MHHDITKSVIVQGRASELYRIWDDLENLPRYMENLVAVRKTGERTSRWTARGPMGVEVEWDVETTTREPPKRIGWNSRVEGIITTSGQVTFNQLAEGQTEVTVHMKVVPRGGVVTETLVNLLANPESRLDEDLRAFKRNAERVLRDAHHAAPGAG
jgi:uncharacterized membrane protein